MQKLESSFTRHKDSTTRRIADAREETKRAVAQEMQERAAAREKVLEDRIAELERGQTFPQNSVITPNTNTVNSPETFGERKLPPRPTSYSNDNPDINHMQYAPSEQTLFRSDSFDSHNFSWVSEEDTYRRTIDNYVPTGTFVTAIVTGGADTNAGVLDQGDTTPVVFQTFHEGILPNGQKSRLNDCTITASAYGEISSSRGIVRTDRLSCIFENGDILDVAVKGTAFNFGRNGIRGTTILKNGEIVQMAGIAGILTGIGETGEALSQTTSTSALGSTSSVTY
ncbi:TraB/VirB10 family protein [Vibrio harveyi]|uniref:TraB/VirB10 family protein n=1 Tax=Vibrio harveyi TaxID=669 RepID=UPI00338E4B37